MPTLGSEIPPRRLKATIVLGIGVVVGLVLLGSLAQHHGTADLITIGIAALVLVVVPLGYGLHLYRRHVYADPDGFTIVTGSRERRFAYAEVDRVVPRVDQLVKIVDSRSVSLIVQVTSAGRRRRTIVSAQELQTIDPILLGLEPRVRLRPELLANDWDRDLFESSVAAAHERTAVR